METEMKVAKVLLVDIIQYIDSAGLDHIGHIL